MLSPMPFRSLPEVENRLGDPTPLTPQEIRELLPWISQVGEPGMRRLTAQLALQSHEAVQKFERRSGSLTKWLVGLTVAFVFLTILTAYDSLILSRLGIAGRQSSSARESEDSATLVTSTKKTLGPWKVKFGIPGSAEVPERSPVLKYSFDHDVNSGFGYITVTAENLTDHPYSVRYSIFGYDENARRVSEGSDDFTIAKRETVVRKVFLVSQQSLQIGSVFSIEATLQE